tara:strand:+ start:87 stop:452 length:366 start_codon:yes stop_codon:yes gene_type:complete
MSEHMICRDENGEPCTQCKDATGWIWTFQDLALNAHRGLQLAKPCPAFPEKLKVEYVVDTVKEIFKEDRDVIEMLPPPPAGMRKQTMLLYMSKEAQKASSDMASSEYHMERAGRKGNGGWQ